MKTSKIAQQSSMLMITAGVGGMMLGVAAYKLTHFAPAVLLGTVLSVVVTFLATQRK